MSAACALALVMGWATNASAQAPTAPGKLHGQLIDVSGKPIPNVKVTLKNNATLATTETTTDSNGRYNENKVQPGNYTVTMTSMGQAVYEFVMDLAPGQDVQKDVNFKEMQASAGKDQAEAEKKAAEAKAKFTAMKANFDAGKAALATAQQTRIQYDKLPKDQQATLQGQLDEQSGTAVTALQSAIEGTGDTDPNRGLLLATLGDAYATDGKYQDAADAYSKAVVLRPDPGAYNNLGNALARVGKVDDALAAYQKAIELDPTNTATYWRNFAIGLYNTGRIKESVDPLRKATEADPTNAQAWYLLGAALVNTMDFKKDGDNLVPVLQPGTIEAYQKCIALAPDGPYAAQAKQGLDALQAMGVGINTKVNNGKKK
jgi:tetratricopeptide (TPR) repeat protein